MQTAPNRENLSIVKAGLCINLYLGVSPSSGSLLWMKGTYWHASAQNSSDKLLPIRQALAM